MKKLGALILLVVVFWLGDLNAQVRLPRIFTDNMVLQQQSEVPLWGWSKAGSVVNVLTSWNGKSHKAKADDSGKWMVKVSTPSAGGPYSISIKNDNTVTLKNVLIGEVWVCSGQSNMEMPMKGYQNQPVTGSADAILMSSNSNIRLFTVEKATSVDPLENFKGEWKKCEPENVYGFSSTAYYFGLWLNKLLNVPVGLINTSWGGTRIEPWISEAGCRNFDWVKVPAKDQKVSQQTPTALFNAMVSPMVGYGIRGAIWYQGESNKNEPDQYQKLLPGLVQNWRSLWGIGDFPFYYMQIAPYNYGSGLNSAYLREAQLKVSALLPNSGMACIMDIAERDCIHPAQKETGSKRLAMLALEKTYGFKGISGQSPVFKEMTVSGEMVKITFDNAPNGLTSFGKELASFEVAGANKRFYPAKASVTGEGVKLYSPFVTEPVAVRYAFQDFVIGDLFGTNGLPVSSFRSDQW